MRCIALALKVVPKVRSHQLYVYTFHTLITFPLKLGSMVDHYTLTKTDSIPYLVGTLIHIQSEFSKTITQRVECRWLHSS